MKYTVAMHVRDTELFYRYQLFPINRSNSIQFPILTIRYNYNHTFTYSLFYRESEGFMAQSLRCFWKRRVLSKTKLRSPFVSMLPSNQNEMSISQCPVSANGKELSEMETNISISSESTVGTKSTHTYAVDDLDVLNAVFYQSTSVSRKASQDNQLERVVQEECMVPSPMILREPNFLHNHHYCDTDTSTDAPLKSKESIALSYDYDDCNTGAISLNTSVSIFLESAELIRNKKVSFSEVEFREYGIILGDNPSCSHGPPIALGWDLMNSFSLPLDEFERISSDKRRSLKELLLPRHVRERLLLELDYSRSEIREVTIENTLIREHRKRNAKKPHLHRLVEGLKNSIRNGYRPSRSSKKIPGKV